MAKEVEVVNDGSKPIPTYDVDAIMREPFQDETQIGLIQVNSTIFVSVSGYLEPMP